MAGDESSPTDPVAALARLAAEAHAATPPPERRYQPAEMVPDRALGVLNGLLVLGLLLAVAISTYALLNL
jgi:hypothetical protein